MENWRIITSLEPKNVTTFLYKQVKPQKYVISYFTSRLSTMKLCCVNEWYKKNKIAKKILQLIPLLELQVKIVVLLYETKSLSPKIILAK